MQHSNEMFLLTPLAGRCDQSCSQHLSYRSDGRPSCLWIVPRRRTSEPGSRHFDATAEIRQLRYGRRQLHRYSTSQRIHSTRYDCQLHIISKHDGPFAKQED